MSKFEIPVSADAQKIFSHARPVAPDGKCGNCDGVNWNRYCETCTNAMLAEKRERFLERRGFVEVDRSEHEEFERDDRVNDGR